MERGGALLELTIYGQPAGAGSKTAHVVTRGDGSIVWRSGPKILPGQRVIGQPMLNYNHASKKTAPWMRAVSREAGVAWSGLEPIDGAVWLDVDFYELRPTTHYFVRKSGRVLRPDAPAYPSRTETHDSDKMRRAICDALKQGGVIVDDKRVVGGELWKDFVENLPTDAEGREPKAVIRLGLMEAQTAVDLGLASPAPDGQQSLVS